MLSKRIAYLRKKNSMSQAQLANKIGISPSALGMYEQGRRTPGIDTLTRFSEIFNVSLDYLITGSEFNHPIVDDNDMSKRTNCPCSTCFWREYVK